MQALRSGGLITATHIKQVRQMDLRRAGAATR